jgi:galactokinase
MTTEEVSLRLVRQFAEHFGRCHTVTAYAPGRVEVLGNHTDYNEGYVLSAAINMGTCFMAAPSPDNTCRLVAGDLMKEVTFDVTSRTPVKKPSWSNYVKGVFVKLHDRNKAGTGFWGMFLGNLPLGAGLSSSAALETASGLALASLYGMDVPKLDLAKIGQAAEHEFAGVKCGLLDQISSLFGRENHLVMSDFRTLKAENVPMGEDACFLMCNTRAKHSLVDSKYNERRAKCEEAARFFSSTLAHPVTALRDVSWEEWKKHSPSMEPVAARRSAHVIGENTRVLEGRELLNHGDLAGFGKLMFESHESSIVNFENSCKELDFLVSAAKKIPGVLGARLSGGGFGGSVVVLLHPRDVEAAGQALAAAYNREFGHPCDARVVVPSAGARVLAK